MLRSWQDVVAKWKLLPGGGWVDPSGAQHEFDRARYALVAGRLDEAKAGFEAAAAARRHPLDHVGIGDVHLARGRWREAARQYRYALDADPQQRLAQLGMAAARIAGGDAEGAVRDLERMLEAAPTDRVLRYYVASGWCSVAEQCRSRTADDILVITSERQLQVCERAANRILELDVEDHELIRGARRLLAEVSAGRRWSWRPEGIAVSLAVLVCALGLTMVALGGVTGSVALVLVGMVVGGALLAVVVMRFRRQHWRLHAQSMARQIHLHGR
jgi:tetratricopeptide (TPR) repeat protein